ncbi:hypothetical protein D9757_014017 [Collybiopsis confluens]|uniref:Uncharacterized protein n=1 Tax=Collybiopsis confluens TaxID=2823264 RepID=A0A8H5D6F5_9AGAR|nr:hypothetical protein D9757_014017 [Collybiopsis confluens]
MAESPHFSQSLHSFRNRLLNAKRLQHRCKEADCPPFGPTRTCKAIYISQLSHLINQCHLILPFLNLGGLLTLASVEEFDAVMEQHFSTTGSAPADTFYINTETHIKTLLDLSKKLSSSVTLYRRFTACLQLHEYSPSDGLALVAFENIQLFLECANAKRASLERTLWKAFDDYPDKTTERLRSVMFKITSEGDPFSGTIPFMAATDFCTLGVGRWLNDEIVNYFIEKWCTQSGTLGLSTFFANSHLFQASELHPCVNAKIGTLTAEDERRVLRWCSKAVDRILHIRLKNDIQHKQYSAIEIQNISARFTRTADAALHAAAGSVNYAPVTSGDPHPPSKMENFSNYANAGSESDAMDVDELADGYDTDDVDGVVDVKTEEFSEKERMEIDAFEQALDAAAEIVLTEDDGLFNFLPDPLPVDPQKPVTQSNTSRKTISSLFEDDTESRTWKWHPTAGKPYGRRPDIHQRWEALFASSSPDSSEPYHPFSSRLEWELSQWAIKEQINHSSFDRLLKIPQVKERLGISFSSARAMLKKVDEIPDRCGPWYTKVLSFKDRPDETFTIHHRDPLHAIRALWGDPKFAKDLVYKPVRLYRGSVQSEEERVFSEMWTAGFWNAAQTCIPNGGTVAPVIIASDKTQLTQFSGSKSAYPVYLTLGNIPKAIRRKPGARACILIAYLSVDKPVKAKLSKKALKLRNYELFHISMALVLDPLKAAGDPKGSGVEMVGGDGTVRQVYPLLAAYVADYPEQCLVTCTKYGTCPKCRCKADDLGMPIPGERRTQAWTTETIQACRSQMRHRGGLESTPVSWRKTLLGGVFKHLVSWVQDVVGEEELDERIRRLPFLDPNTNILREFSCLLHFIQLAQYPSHDQDTLGYMKDELDNWHKYRSYFIHHGPRDHFNIPKFHSLLHYADSIRWLGTTDNYNTEAFERYHIDAAKQGWEASNKRDHFPQMTRWLSRQEKVCSYDFYLSWVGSDVISDDANLARSLNEEEVDSRDQELEMVKTSQMGSATKSIFLSKYPQEPRKKLTHILASHSSPSFISDLKLYLNALLPDGQQEKRASALQSALPFTTVDVWHHFKFTPIKLLDEVERETVKASPITRKNQIPRFDTVLVLESPSAESTAVQGCRAARVRVIFRLPNEVYRYGFPVSAPQNWPTGPLIYVTWFTRFKPAPDRSTGMNWACILSDCVSYVNLVNNISITDSNFAADMQWNTLSKASMEPSPLPQPNSTVVIPFSCIQLANPNPNHSPRLLNLSMTGNPQHGHGHGHNASFSQENTFVSGTHPSSQTLLGPPFQPNETLDGNPSTTIRPDASMPFPSLREQHEGGLGASSSSSSNKLDLSLSFRMRSRSLSRTRASLSTSGENNGAQSPGVVTQTAPRPASSLWWKHPFKVTPQLNLNRGNSSPLPRRRSLPPPLGFHPLKHLVRREKMTSPGGLSLCQLFPPHTHRRAELRRLHDVTVPPQVADLITRLSNTADDALVFCNSHGVEALVDQIEYEVDLDIREHGDQQKSRQIFGSHGELPVVRAAVLKHILRSMHRMMQSSGTSEGLRGLIDMSILGSIKKIIYRGLFGPSVLPIAINIMATFVHNEPGSLTVIQEAGLPETFYKSIELGLEPAIEVSKLTSRQEVILTPQQVIQAIPNAIGVLCLNEVGQSQLAAHPSIIPAIFFIFTSDRHLKILLEKENAVLVVPPPSTISEVSEEAGDKMEGVETSQSSLIETTANPLTLAALLDPRSEEAMRLHENNIISFIDILGRAFFNTRYIAGISSLKTDGVVCLVSDASMVQTMRTLTEVAPTETLQQLSFLVKESLQATHDFWATGKQESNLLPLLNVTEESYDNLNFYFRNLIALHVRVTLLSDVFATAGFAHGRGAIALLQTLMNSTTPQVIADLGSLHRASIWENIVFKAALAVQGIEVTDMGFPRAAAEHALRRTHNNVPAATEIHDSTSWRVILPLREHHGPVPSLRPTVALQKLQLVGVSCFVAAVKFEVARTLAMEWTLPRPTLQSPRRLRWDSNCCFCFAAELVCRYARTARTSTQQFTFVVDSELGRFERGEIGYVYSSSLSDWCMLYSTQAQELTLCASVVPTVSVTPSSRPSTVSRSSTDTTPKQLPVQPIPTKSTLEAGAPVLDVIRNQVLTTSSSSQTIVPNSSTLPRIDPSTIISTSATSSSGISSAVPISPALIPSRVPSLPPSPCLPFSL